MSGLGPVPERVLLVGGTSEIGLATVRALAARGPVAVGLLGRDTGGLARAAEGLRAVAGVASVLTAVADAEQTETHERAVAEAFAALGGAEVVVLAVGVLGAQAGLDADRAEAIRVMHVGFTGTASLMMACLDRLRAQAHGTLVVLSSVAAERPRASNAVYGAAKAGLDALAQGLADATAGTGVRVLVVRPGFVHTRMTEGLEPAPLATTPEAVAETIVGALGSRAHTVWAPPALRPLFATLRHLPRGVYRRLPI